MKIAVIHGPNLNRLGRRDPERYGTQTLAELNGLIAARASELGVEIETVQSNHEGVLVDWVHERVDAEQPVDAIIVNPASLTPYGRSLAQAIAEAGVPVIVVHISSVYRNAKPGRVDLYAETAEAVITGFGSRGYLIALEQLVSKYKA